MAYTTGNDYHTLHHTGMPSFPCPQCGKRFASTSAMRLCLAAHAGKVADAAGDRGGDAKTLFGAFARASGMPAVLAAFDALLQGAEAAAATMGPAGNRPRATLASIGEYTAGIYAARQLFSTLAARYSEDSGEYAAAPLSGTSVLVVGAGPAGLRCAIELAFLGASVTVLERRADFTRNNIVLLWSSSIADLLALGCKTFYPPIGVGDRSHLGLRRLQQVLLQVALLAGVTVQPGMRFEGLVPDEATGGTAAPSRRQARVLASDGTRQTIAFDHLIGADGETSNVSPACGFGREVFQGGEAIGLTVNFVNRRSPPELALNEVSFAVQYNRAYFQRLAEATGGVRFENLCYYQAETHYVVCTPQRKGLLAAGVLRRCHKGTAALLQHDNVDADKLHGLCHSIGGYIGIPGDADLALAPEGTPDVALFDFSSKSQATTACVDLHGRCMAHLVGDALLAPFWPQGTGANRAMLSALDTAHFILQLGDRSGSADHGACCRQRDATFAALKLTLADGVKDALSLDPSVRYALMQ